jgi:hypothetical protein
MITLVYDQPQLGRIEEVRTEVIPMGCRYMLIARQYDNQFWLASKHTNSLAVALWTFLVWSFRFDVIEMRKG